MDVILLEDLKGVGSKGGVVNVKPGYARNYLLPRRLAIAAGSRSANLFQELERLLPFGGPSRAPRLVEQRQRVALRVEEEHAAALAAEALDFVPRADEPARIPRGDLLESRTNPVFVLQAMEHHVELQHADGADDRRRARHVRRGSVEDLRGSLFGELTEAGEETRSARDTDRERGART